MKFKKILLPLFVFTGFFSSAQDCNCSNEFLFIKNFIEQNYAGYSDKLTDATKPAYTNMSNQLLQLTKQRLSKQKCLLIILQYLDWFKDHHIQVSPIFDATKTDSSYIKNGELFRITPSKLEQLRHSKSIEGIYYFGFDSSYKIAVIKDKTPLRDYVGIMLESKILTWKTGLVKFEAKLVEDSLLKGVLYIRNHMPRVEWLFVGKNSLGVDWQREGTTKETYAGNPYVAVDSKKLSDSTLYLKISTFNASNAKRIDSMFRAHRQDLTSMPNLVLDLRNNGGGSDFSYKPILPYLYTNPVKTVGVDVFSTDANIAGWKKILEDKDIPEESRKWINNIINNMENNKGKMISMVNDEIDTLDKVLPYPKKVIILVNKRCASTTEQFLLYAKQSSKVILLGENTQGTLDYSNMRETNFSCLPYVLDYATTKSRRLNIKRGIDNIGIKPDQYLKPGTDWLAEALKIAEQ